MRQDTYLRHVLATAYRHGWALIGLDDGGDDIIDLAPMKPAVAQFAAQRHAVNVDSCTLMFRHDDGGMAWAWVIWQGPLDTYPDGDEVIADHSSNLTPVIDTANRALRPM